MYKDKPLIIQKRPFWRNPAFPWGWYSFVNDKIVSMGVITADGYYKPSDGGGGTFKMVMPSNWPDNSGEYVSVPFVTNTDS